MRFRTRIIRRIGDLLRVLDRQLADNSLVWFRGQGDSTWKLVPGLGRENVAPEAESTLIKRFKQNALPHVEAKPSTEWEWLILMQHHRLKTRLLDWTESPLVALFFAVHDEISGLQDATLWCIDPIALNRHANVDFEHTLEIPAFDHDQILDIYSPTRVAQETQSYLPPIAAIAFRNSTRIAAQLGTFPISHRDFTPIEEIGDRNHIWRIAIPANAKSTIARELRHLGYTRLTLFPELDSVADEAQEVLS